MVAGSRDGRTSGHGGDDQTEPARHGDSEWRPSRQVAPLEAMDARARIYVAGGDDERHMTIVAWTAPDEGGREMTALASMLVRLSLLAMPLLGLVLARRYLLGADLARFDQPRPRSVNAGQPVSSGQARIQTMLEEHEYLMRAEDWPALRIAFGGSMLEFFGDDMQPSADVEFRDVRAGEVPAEWVLAPGVDPDERLLYVHGGLFMIGNPKTHRTITERLSRRLGVAVLAIDYRLLPEHRRTDGIADCRQAYGWILEHGPAGPGRARELWVGGDSAGGNLSLMLVAWARDEGLRQANGVIGLSPVTDETFASPSMRANADSDHCLRPLGQLLRRLPRIVVGVGQWWDYRRSPADPMLSPLRGDLASLPPTLLLASTAEMLLDDSVRYANKAREAGSPVELRLWDHAEHIWPFWAPVLDEGEAAFDHIVDFVEAHR